MATLRSVYSVSFVNDGQKDDDGSENDELRWNEEFAVARFTDASHRHHVTLLADVAQGPSMTLSAVGVAGVDLCGVWTAGHIVVTFFNVVGEMRASPVAGIDVEICDV